MDTKECLWPGHPLFQLVIDYAFDAGEKGALCLITNTPVRFGESTQEALEAAAKNDWVEVLQHLWDIQYMDLLLIPPALFKAAERGNTKSIGWLLSKELVNKRQLDYALVGAIRGNQMRTMRFLEQMGALYQCPAIHHAAKTSNAALIEYVAEKTAEHPDGLNILETALIVLGPSNARTMVEKRLAKLRKLIP